MSGMKKALALILAIVMMTTVGAVAASAVAVSEETAVAATSETITIHVKQDGLAQPYIYLWNSLPTNGAMSKTYPGEKMTASGEWFTYTLTGYTKVNALITDASGKQYSKEQTITNVSADWWYSNNRWSKYNPEETDPVESLDPREDTIYFVMTTRFYDGDSGNNVHCWDDSRANNPDSDPAWRGDFKGLAEKLDYIKALGFNAIWITPVVTNASGYDYHGYHAMDFSTVDVRYESDDFDFDDLIRTVHSKGMKIYQDVVFQHTGNFGESHFCPLFTKDTTKDLSNLQESMIPTDYLLDAYHLSSPEAYWAQDGDTQYRQRLNLMKNVSSDYSGVENSKGHQPDKSDLDDAKVSHSSIYNPNNYYHTGYFQSHNYDNWTTKFCQIAGDCVDLNTENPAVAEYITDTYAEYINRGVDGFRVDTVRHIPRLVLNLMFNNQIHEAAAAAGKPNFLMFGEICTRYTQIWYRGHAEESTPYYTWKEPNAKWANSWHWGTTADDVNANMNLVLNHYLEEDNYEKDLSSLEPTSQNATLNNLSYHTPDRSMASGMEAIDFQMHRMFGNASNAFNFAKNNDKFYNDATYNVMYVDSHDYAPEQPDEFTRFTGGTQAWAEDLDLMFTFRGIPCVYYGSEVEFQKGKQIDKGTDISLANSGRAYYGSYLEGDVTASDFGEYTASGTVQNTLNSTLAQHLMKLNKIRRAIPALQKGQYTTASNYVSGNMAYIRRYTDNDVDSLACVAISGGATFNNIPNGRYVDAVTGDVKNVTNGTLTVPSIAAANMRVYVCCAQGFTGISGAVGGTTNYLK